MSDNESDYPALAEAAQWHLDNPNRPNEGHDRLRAALEADATPAAGIDVTTTTGPAVDPSDVLSPVEEADVRAWMASGEDADYPFRNANARETTRRSGGPTEIEYRLLATLDHARRTHREFHGASRSAVDGAGLREAAERTLDWLRHHDSPETMASIEAALDEALADDRVPAPVSSDGLLRAYIRLVALTHDRHSGPDDPGPSPIYCSECGPELTRLGISTAVFHAALRTALEADNTPAAGIDVERLARAMNTMDERHHDPEHGRYRGLDNDPILAEMIRKEAAELAAEYDRLGASDG